MTDEQEKNPLMVKARAARRRLALAAIDSAFCDVAFRSDVLEKSLVAAKTGPTAESVDLVVAVVDLVVAVRALGEAIEKAKAL